jgi:hypothetical protein
MTFSMMISLVITSVTALDMSHLPPQDHAPVLPQADLTAEAVVLACGLFAVSATSSEYGTTSHRHAEFPPRYIFFGERRGGYGAGFLPWNCWNWLVWETTD